MKSLGGGGLGGGWEGRWDFRNQKHQARNSVSQIARHDFPNHLARLLASMKVAQPSAVSLSPPAGARASAIMFGSESMKESMTFPPVWACCPSSAAATRG